MQPRPVIASEAIHFFRHCKLPSTVWSVERSNPEGSGRHCEDEVRSNPGKKEMDCHAATRLAMTGWLDCRAASRLAMTCSFLDCHAASGSG
ncbi:MAG: hypothetical protein LBE71_04355 [Dysgonamonadaceae bacterium]|nr:hypothetical protein [Dysgonamonadaceae bacterium]